MREVEFERIRVSPPGRGISTPTRGNDLSGDTELREQYSAEIGDFVDFLDEVKPALFVSASLTTILRTEPPVVFGPVRVADLAAEWAERRSAETGGRVCDYMLSAIRAIVDAYNTSAVSDFRPRHFYWEFRDVLMDRCPPGERADFAQALSGLEGNMPRPESSQSTGDLTVAAAALRRSGAMMAEAESPEQALTRLASDPKLSDEDFDRSFAVIDRAVAGDAFLPP